MLKRPSEVGTELFVSGSFVSIRTLRAMPIERGRGSSARSTPKAAERLGTGLCFERSPREKDAFEASKRLAMHPSRFF